MCLDIAAHIVTLHTDISLIQRGDLMVFHFHVGQGRDVDLPHSALMTNQCIYYAGEKKRKEKGIKDL